MRRREKRTGGERFKGCDWRVEREDGWDGRLLLGPGLQKRREDGVSLLEAVVDDVDEVVGVSDLRQELPGGRPFVVERRPLLADGEGFVLPGDEGDAVGRREGFGQQKMKRKKERGGDERFDDAVRRREGRGQRAEGSEEATRGREGQT